MKKYTFIVALCVSISINTLLPMKRLPEETLESSCTKKIAYSLMTQEQNRSSELYSHCYQQPIIMPYSVPPVYYIPSTNPLLYTIEKPYICTFDGCNKVFIDQCRLNKHMCSHADEKPYICTFKGCTKAYKDNSNLKRHMHSHTDKKDCACTVEGCNKSFREQFFLKRHMRTHTKEKPFICTFCNKSFSDKNNCNRHMRIHTKEKLYTCTVNGCNQSFTDSSHCKKHIRTHVSNNSPVSIDNKKPTNFSHVNEQTQKQDDFTFFTPYYESSNQQMHLYSKENPYEYYENEPSENL